VPVWLVGALGGGVLAICAPLQESWLYGTPAPEIPGVLGTAAVAVAAGALAGFLGTRFGDLLRQLAPNKETSRG
jgi:hypothetical protein